MKKVLLLFVFIGICAGGYFAYQKYFQPQVVNAWSLVPKNAVIAYETDRFSTTWENLQDKKVWKTLSTLPAVKKLADDLIELDNSKENKGLIKILTNQNKLIISLFPISKSELGSLYILEINNITQHASISNLLEQNYNRKTRKYNGFTISELTSKSTEKKLSFIFYKNYFIGSSTPFLVEDAIRTINENDYSSFKENHEELFQLVRLEKDDGNLYINSSRARDIVDLFYNGTKAEIDVLSNITSSTFLDISSTDNEILFNGFSLLKKEEDFLNVFDGNSPGTFKMANFISNDAMFLTHYSFTKPKLFLSNLSDYRKKYDNKYQETSTLLNKYDIKSLDISEWLGDEIGLYHTTNGKISVVNTKDNLLANRQLKEISNRVATLKGDTVYSEVFENYEITFFPLENFPELFFGNSFEGFEEVFYLSMEDKIIFSNQLQALKDLIEDIKNENTWGKSLKFNQFFENVNKESNLSYLINTRNAWRSILNSINKDWTGFVSNNELILKEFELLGIQFSNVDNKYFTNISVLHPGEFKEQTGSKSLQAEISLSFDHSLSYKPKIVRNHLDNSRELIVQDSSKKTYLLSKDFDILWIDSLAGKISSKIYQVDYFKNGKLQYLFATNNQLNLIDRSGKTVGNYPITIGKNAISTLNVIDYSKNKKYRWAVSDVSGNLFLLDKKGKKLKNWSPNKKKYKLDSEIKHTRILGKDLIMVCLELGVFDVINRQGHSYPGFPINFDKDIDSQYILKPGSSFNKSTGTFITRDGEVITVNLRGKYLRRDQLVEGSKNANYAFVKDVGSNKYVISVIDRKKIAILDSNGELKFKKEYLNNGELLIQYYRFGAGNELIIMTDLQQEFTYLYDGNGNLINSIPIENNQGVSVLYSQRKKEFEMFTNYKNRLDKYIFPLNN